MNHMNTAGHCRCVHHKVVPVLVILIGLVFLLGYMNVLTASFVNISWPVLLIIIGAVKLGSGSCKCYMQPVQ